MFVNVIDKELKDILCDKGCKLLNTYVAEDKTIWVFDESSMEFALQKYDNLDEKAFLSDGKAFLSNVLIMRFD